MLRLLLVAAAVSEMLASCAWQPVGLPEGETGAPPGFPESYYRETAARGTPVYRIDSAASRVVILVRRGGPLARLGHDHVVSGNELQGFVAPGVGRADLYLRLDRLVVDDPGLRAEARFETVPTAEEIAGTRNNMLKALDAERFPFARVGVSISGASLVADVMPIEVTLHGITRQQDVPVRMETRADEVALSGRVMLKQTDFGITPMSVLGGAIQVQDQVELLFRIRAVREAPG